ncbi:DUF2975 domain-containing protein [Roseivirga spongicola]|uniref:DUF2975 domain-containing protein n=1 Tax=Roseivirga spongicola TaxID=333140 RepID=A0A150XIF5_9BACT|nr:DUF2975 domain-containing protein [Roseivirga spongicola]KYG78486.1 hypothetical protein AWW68_06875 [Roseivirga spongicola]WPZ12237.1 DUF2975 domain-containing protein [Roseivirga spongicola]
MKWNRLVIKSSSWVLDTFIGISVIIFIVALIVLIRSGFNDGQFSLRLNEDYKSWVVKPEVEPSPGFESAFEVVNVEPTEHIITFRLHDNRLYLTYIPFALYASICFYILVLLSGIVNSAKRNEFFSHLNVKRLRIIGILVVLSGLVDYLGSFFKQWVFENFLTSADLTSTSSFWVFRLPNIFTSTFITGLLVLVIAEAFAHGLKLKEEQDLTI